MRENFNKRLDLIEAAAGPTKSMIILCNDDEDLEQKVAEWEASDGVPSPNGPLIIIRSTSRIDK